MSLRRDNEFHSFVVRPATAGPAATGTEGAGVTVVGGWTALTIAAVSWLRVQRPLWWWRVLVAGAAVLGIAWLAIVPDTLTALVPFYAIAFAALLPVVAVVAWWEREGRYTEFNWDLPLALLGGLAAGVVSGFALYGGWIKLNITTWQGALALAAGEELLKTLVVAYFLWSPRARDVREGLRVGVAAALGFMLAQMALASYLAYHLTVTVPRHAETGLFRAGIANMDHMLGFQLALQVLGEVIWTAAICAAIWRERGGRRFYLTPGLVAVVVAVLLLHGAFNYVYANGWVELRLGGAFLPLVNLLLAGISFALLRFFLIEEREQETLGSLPPAPLHSALVGYIGEGRRHLARWNAGVLAASRATTPVTPLTKTTRTQAPALARSSAPRRSIPHTPQTMEPPEPSNPPDSPEPRTPPNTEWLV